MNQFISFINKREKLLVWLGIALYFIVFSLICVWKYYQFGYNGLDLAIYNQVFFNSAHGNLFGFTIHPQSYLGDHFELFLIALLPIYYFFQHPLALLILQTLVLALSAWPLYLIAKNVLAKPWPLFIAFLWLLNPFVQNINLFEFHLLPFSLFFLLFAFYFYQKNKFFAFLLSCFLALLVREDVALVILMFSVLALIEKKSIKWIIWPAAMAVGWFLLAIKIIAYYTPAGSYKFLYYYSWLGSNVSEMVVNFFGQPLNALKHLGSFNNILFTVVLFMPFGYLSLVKPKYLLLALPIYLQIILGGSSNSTIVLKIHYASLFLPGLFIALIWGLKKVERWKYREVFWITLVVGTLYGALTLGPILGFAQSLIKPGDDKEIMALKKEFLNAVPRQSSVVTTYEFLTNLSSRLKVYGLNYAFIGKKQFTDLDYQLPNDVEIILMDADDFLTFGVQFPNSRQWQQYYQNGDDNLRKLIDQRGFKVSKIIDSLVILEKDNDWGIRLYETAAQFNDVKNKQNINLDDKMKFLGFSPITYPPSVANYRLLPVALYFKPLQKMEENYQLKLLLKNKNGQIVHEKLYPLAYGLYPTTEWQTNETVKINYWFLMPAGLPESDYQINLELLNYKGYLTLDGLRSAIMKITEETALKPEIILKLNQ